MARSLLVFSGGGARGALHVASAEKVHRETEVAGAVGISIGASHALAAASGQIPRMRPMWEDIDRQSDFMELTPLTPGDGLHSLRPLREMLTEEDWGPVKLPLWVGVFDYQKAEPRLVDCRDLERRRVINWVLASSQIPVVHDAQAIGAKFWGDGGIHSPVPIPKGFWTQFDELHVIISTPLMRLDHVEPEDVDGAWEQGMRMLDYMVHRSVLESVRQLKLMARRRRDIPIYLYAPKNWRVVGPTFDRRAQHLREQIARRLEHGELMARTPKRLR